MHVFMYVYVSNYRAIHIYTGMFIFLIIYIYILRINSDHLPALDFVTSDLGVVTLLRAG